MSDFELDRLGAREFERLCQALLVQDHGSIEVRSGAGDFGADAFTRRALHFPDPDQRARGPFVFQVKFVEDASELGRRAVTRLCDNVRRERAHIERRIEAGTWTVPRHYALITNVRVPPSSRSRVVNALAPALAAPKSRVHILDRHWMNAKLAAMPGLRRSFPVLLSFRDLATVVHDELARPLRNRSQAFLDAAIELQDVFVATDAYAKALAMLQAYGFAVLTGPPESGKTAIAKVVAIVQSAERWDVIDCHSPDDFEHAFDSDRRQLFIADDVFGSTEYQPIAARAWERALPHVIPRLGDRHWFVWTSRPAPLREGLAALHLQGAAEDFPAPAHVTVDVADLSAEARALILYSHCRQAPLDHTARSFVARHGAAIASHPRFTPWRARRFATQANALIGARSDDPDAVIDDAMSNVTRSMQTAFDCMTDEQHLLLLSMLDTHGDGSVATIEVAYDRHRPADGAVGRSARSLLHSLEEQVIRRMDPEDRYAWAHPTWRDLTIVRLSDDPEKRRRFLTRCGISGLELAASTAGGSGDRQRPLLRTASDHRLFAERILAQSKTERLDTHRRLLLIASGLQHEQAEGVIGFADLMRPLLEELRKRWDDAGCLIPADVLELYYDASTTITPLLAGPLLDRTYEAHCERMAARFYPAAIAEYEDALAFIETTRRNEPRALRSWGHPQRWERGLERLVSATQKRAEAGSKLLSQRRTTAWERRARKMSAELLRWRQVLRWLDREAFAISQPASESAGRLRSVEHQLESQLTAFRGHHVRDEAYHEYLVRGAPRSDDSYGRLEEIFTPLAPDETA